ncbi:MAG: hypothetical protein EBY20_05985 [Alphaproteobacteria bacterium]|uniref:DUF1997 domain-containing protein n=1 Tax=viral metagenome TaxID=1070528 RepID=A0A6C0HQV1_9ZZZZ|nr:hypothetical protein [Alphaproteobacteria bacterium]
MNLHEDKDNDKDADKDESNKTKVIMDKKDYKMTRIDKYNYLFEYEITNNKILLDKVINLDFIKLIYELNKHDIFDDFYLDVTGSESATVYILFKHFFDDFGVPQKYAHIDISIEKKEKQIIFKTTTNNVAPKVNIPNKDAQLIPINSVTATCDLITPHKASIKTATSFHKSMQLPEFIEKLATTVISKIFLRTKQFIEKIAINNTT